MSSRSIRWIKDPTGRFPERPFYRQEDLDNLSEGWIVGFLMERYGKAEFPVSTEDLTVMIERDTSDLDQYADLSEEGEEDEEVQGLTLFYRDRKPEVKIAQELADDGYRENRLRTTLTHEFAHVKLHGGLWPFDQPRLFPDVQEAPGPRCKRPGEIGGYGADWMEWQAGYVSGAVLMPISLLKGLVQEAFTAWGAFGNIPRASAQAADLIARVAHRFDVSTDAARVRLSQLGCLTDGSPGQSLRLG